MSKYLMSELLKIAAEMALCRNMPSKYHDDWDWPKVMQITSWRKVFDASYSAENQCKDWAIRVRKLADSFKVFDCKQLHDSNQDKDDICPHCNKPWNDNF